MAEEFPGLCQGIYKFLEKTQVSPKRRKEQGHPTDCSRMLKQGHAFTACFCQQCLDCSHDCSLVGRSCRLPRGSRATTTMMMMYCCKT